MEWMLTCCLMPAGPCSAVALEGAASRCCCYWPCTAVALEGAASSVAAAVLGPYECRRALGQGQKA